MRAFAAMPRRAATSCCAQPQLSVPARSTPSAIPSAPGTLFEGVVQTADFPTGVRRPHCLLHDLHRCCYARNAAALQAAVHPHQSVTSRSSILHHGCHEVVFAQKSKLRIDTFLSTQLPDVSRSRIKECIQGGRVLVNSEPRVKAAQALKTGDTVSCALPAPRISAAVPENIPLDIVYDDESVIVVNKPAGAMLVRHMIFLSCFATCQCELSARTSTVLPVRTSDDMMCNAKPSLAPCKVRFVLT